MVFLQYQTHKLESILTDEAKEEAQESCQKHIFSKFVCKANKMTGKYTTSLYLYFIRYTEQNSIPLAPIAGEGVLLGLHPVPVEAGPPPLAAPEAALHPLLPGLPAGHLPPGHPRHRQRAGRLAGQ